MGGFFTGLANVGKFMSGAAGRTALGSVAGMGINAAYGNEEVPLANRLAQGAVIGATAGLIAPAAANAAWSGIKKAPVLWRGANIGPFKIKGVTIDPLEIKGVKQYAQGRLADYKRLKDIEYSKEFLATSPRTTPLRGLPLWRHIRAGLGAFDKLPITIPAGAAIGLGVGIATGHPLEGTLIGAAGVPALTYGIKTGVRAHFAHQWMRNNLGVAGEGMWRTGMFGVAVAGSTGILGAASFLNPTERQYEVSYSNEKGYQVESMNQNYSQRVRGINAEGDLVFGMNNLRHG